MATLNEVDTIVGIGEWLKSGFDYPDYCVEVLTIKRVVGATDGLVSGECLEDDTGEIIVATGANCDAILIEPVSLVDLKAAAVVKRACLVRGPAVIDSDHLSVDSGEKADALTALAALDIVAVNSALATWTTQDT